MIIAQSHAPGALPVVIDLAARTAHDAAGQRIALTGAEFLCLEALAQAAGHVLSRNTIFAVAIKRPYDDYEDRAADQLVLALRRKLPPDDDGLSVIQTERGSGYRLPVKARRL